MSSETRSQIGAALMADLRSIVTNNGGNPGDGLAILGVMFLQTHALCAVHDGIKPEEAEARLMKMLAKEYPGVFQHVEREYRAYHAGRH